MKRIIINCVILALMFSIMPTMATAPADAGPKAQNNKMCSTIQDGNLTASDRSLIGVGFDDWGYNYQGRLFNGGYCDAYRDAAWCQEYKDVKLAMKWNDAWLSNKDCDGDGLLDRHYGYDGYIGSGAWLTNHQSGNYMLSTSNFVDIGNTDSEAGHELIGWSNVWKLTGSGWGGHVGDLRTVWEQNSGEGGREASLIVNAESGTSKELIIRHLDGQADDSYEVYANSQLIGEYLAEGGTENWETSSFEIPNEIYGDIEITIKATAPAWALQNSYGQLAIDWIELISEKDCYWNYFTKIIAVPSDAFLSGGIWYTAEGGEIGPVIWGSFATIQEVENDSCTELHGLQYLSPVRAGLGAW